MGVNQNQKVGQQDFPIINKISHQNEIDIKLAPQHIHHQNTRKSNICMEKDHFIIERAVCDPKFPYRLWCQLILHVEITFNLLRLPQIQP